MHSASLEKYLCCYEQIRPELLSDFEKLKDIPGRLNDWRILRRTFDIVSYQVQSLLKNVRLFPPSTDYKPS